MTNCSITYDDFSVKRLLSITVILLLFHILLKTVTQTSTNRFGCEEQEPTIYFKLKQCVNQQRSREHIRSKMHSIMNNQKSKVVSLLDYKIKNMKIYRR
jgi:hypothetical protein